VADAIVSLLGDASALDALSLRAQEFATAHTFEREFTLRTKAIEQTLAQSRKDRSFKKAA
jgi:hypothetical protein